MIIVICGPTCLGKSDIAFNLASKLNAEIVNADAFQIYKELNIGVAKPPKEYLEKIPHHLYSFVSPSTPYSIKEYQVDARQVIEDILSRGKNVVMVGGSGLYIRASLYDYEFKDSEEIDMSKYEEMDNETLHKELEKIDPEDAIKIHPNNRRRVMRSIQIYLENGESKSALIAKQNQAPIYENTLFLMPNFDREKLYEKINLRVDKMMEEGLLDEVKVIASKYPNTQAMQAIGYKEFIPFFNNECSLEEAVDKVKQDTRNYAKRQVTFFTYQFDLQRFNTVDDIMEMIKNG